MPTAGRRDSKGVRMPSHHDVLQGLHEHRSFDQVARELDISAGLVYLIATGLPADGSDSISAAEAGRPFALASSQHLVGTPLLHDTGKSSTRDWIHRRVAADGPMQAAAGRGFHHSHRTTS